MAKTAAEKEAERLAAEQAAADEAAAQRAASIRSGAPHQASAEPGGSALDQVRASSAQEAGTDASAAGAVSALPEDEKVFMRYLPASGIEPYQVPMRNLGEKDVRHFVQTVARANSLQDAGAFKIVKLPEGLPEGDPNAALPSG